MDSHIHGHKSYIEFDEVDFDADGEMEILINTDKLNYYFKPAYGGCLFELDIKEKEFNLLDTLSRKPEAYHEKLKHGNVIIGKLPEKKDGAVSIHDLVLAKEPDLDKFLNYDWYQRYSLMDHFMPLNTTLEKISKSSYEELGDFINQPYISKLQKRKDSITVNLTRNGYIWYNGKHEPIEIKKKIEIRKGSNQYKVKYRITNQSKEQLNFLFGVEFNYALLAGNADDRYYYIPGENLEQRKLASLGEHCSISEIGLKDHWLKVDCNLKLSSPARIWRFPIETVSQSEAGFEKVYQSSVVLPHWNLNLAPLHSWEVSINQEISHF